MKSNRGGSRPNSGQPKKEPTVVLTFRIREEWKEIIKKTVSDKVEELKKALPIPS